VCIYIKKREPPKKLSPDVHFLRYLICPYGIQRKIACAKIKAQAKVKKVEYRY
jgi:hypothetical protein